MSEPRNALELLRDAVRSAERQGFAAAHLVEFVEDITAAYDSDDEVIEKILEFRGDSK